MDFRNQTQRKYGNKDMNHYILIPNKEKNSHWQFNLNFSLGKWEHLCVKDVCIMHARKDHNHAYYLEYFFYDTCNLGFMNFTSKKELFSAIQKLLKENIKR